MEWSPEKHNICLEFYRAHSIKILKGLFVLVYHFVMKDYFETLELVKLHHQICETYHLGTFSPIKHRYKEWLKYFKNF